MLLSSWSSFDGSCPSAYCHACLCIFYFVTFQMRYSIVRLGQTFINERQFALPQKGVVPKNAIKISLANLGITIVLSGIVLFFGMPTPDIRHDIRCIIHPDFKKYSQSQRRIYLDHFDERLVRTYQFHDGKVRRHAVYGPINEDIFRMQDYGS